MKIGIYAGTFDPIHEGHVNFAVTAVKMTDLDKVVIVAEKNPYRKKPFASWDNRQAMIERATEDIEEADHDYEFSNQLAHQHTMQNMLEASKAHYGEDNEFWFLVGSDIFEHIARWHDLSQQDEYGGFVVALRDDHTQEWLNEKLVRANEQGVKVKVQLVENRRPHISSKKIRDQILANGNATHLSLEVQKYIASHALYSK